ncbi:MAG: PAC2 family protein [Candidatus Bathyarchaeia archaeon]
MGRLGLENYLTMTYKPKLSKPLLVVELSGPNEPAGIAARILIERSSAKPFAEYYSQYFPDHVIVAEDGVCRLPRYEFYESSKSKPNLVVTCTDDDVTLDDPEGGYEVLENLIQFGLNLEASHLILIDNFQADSGDVLYVAVTSNRLAARLRTLNVKFLGETWLIGPAGILLGLCRLRSIDGLGIFLNQTCNVDPERKAEVSLRLIQELFNIKYA